MSIKAKSEAVYMVEFYYINSFVLLKTFQVIYVIFINMKIK